MKITTRSGKEIKTLDDAKYFFATCKTLETLDAKLEGIRKSNNIRHEEVNAQAIQFYVNSIIYKEVGFLYLAYLNREKAINLENEAVTFISQFS